MIVTFPVVVDQDLAVFTEKFLEPFEKTDQKVEIKILGNFHKCVPPWRQIPDQAFPPKYTAGILRENINKAEANKPLKLLTDLRIPYNKLFVNYITFFHTKSLK